MSMQDRLAQLQPRERRLLGVLMMVVVVFVVVGLPGALMAMASARESENQALRDTIETIERSEKGLSKSAAKRDLVLARYKTPAPTLASWLDRLARAQQLEIPESQDRAVVPHGKKFEERSTKILFRRTGLGKLVRFMESVAQSPYSVVVSKLNIRKRGSEPDSFDVEMIVSAYDRKGSEKTALKELVGDSPSAVGASEAETSTKPDTEEEEE